MNKQPCIHFFPTCGHQRRIICGSPLALRFVFGNLILDFWFLRFLLMIRTFETIWWNSRWGCNLAPATAAPLAPATCSSRLLANQLDHLSVRPGLFNQPLGIRNLLGLVGLRGVDVWVGTWFENTPLVWGPMATCQGITYNKSVSCHPSASFGAFNCAACTSNSVSASGNVCSNWSWASFSMSASTSGGTGCTGWRSCVCS